ncbi:hypothetical protein FRC12_002190 [Ceratobasidium sp. 428]|nr:hypothetical protein FRC12_002190 [Ceratobasidium sp. 428]
MKLSSSNLALATLALSPNLLASPVFAAPTPDVVGLSPNPGTGYFTEPPQHQAMESPLLQGTPTFSGTPALTSTPPASKIAGRRRSISMCLAWLALGDALIFLIERYHSAKFHARESNPDSLGVGLGIGLFGSSYEPGVHVRAVSPLDPVLVNGGEAVTPGGSAASATSAMPLPAPSLVISDGQHMVDLDGTSDHRLPLPFSSARPALLDPVDGLFEGITKKPGNPEVTPTEYHYPQRDARDVQLLPSMVGEVGSPFLNSPVPHDAPTFPPAAHHDQVKRQSAPIPGFIPGVEQVAARSPLGNVSVWGVPGAISGVIPPTGLSSILAPNGLPLSLPNLDTLPSLQNLGGLASANPLGIVTSVTGSISNIPNSAGLTAPAGILGPANGVAGSVLNLLPNPSVSSPGDLDLLNSATNLVGSVTPGILGQVQGVGGVLDGAQGLVPGVQGIVPSVGGLVPNVAGVVPGVGGITSTPLSVVNSAANLLPVPGAAISNLVPGVDPLAVAGALPANIPTSLLNSIPVPVSPSQLDPTAVIHGVAPGLSGAISGAVPIHKGDNAVGGQGVGLGAITGAPGVLSGVAGSLPVPIPVPVPGTGSLPIPSTGQLNSVTAPLGVIPNLVDSVSGPVVPSVAGAADTVPGLVGAATGLLPTSVSAPLPSGMPVLDAIPVKDGMGIPNMAVNQPEMAVYKAAGGMGAMGRPGEVFAKQVEGATVQEGGIAKHIGSNEAPIQGNSFSVQSTELPRTQSLAPSSASISSATPTTVTGQASGVMHGQQGEASTTSMPATEMLPTLTRMIKQVAPTPVSELLAAQTGVEHSTSSVLGAAPTGVLEPAGEQIHGQAH